MVAVSDEEDEPMLESYVLHVGEPALLAVGALALGDVDLVLGQKLAVDSFGVFVGWDGTGDSPE